MGAQASAPVLVLPNQRWSLDFVHDQLATRRRFRVLNIVDNVTRECLAAVVDFEVFRGPLVAALRRSVRGKGGRPPYSTAACGTNC